MSATGLEPIASVAKRSGVTWMCMRYRLKRLAKTIARNHPESPPLLVLVSNGDEDQRPDWRSRSSKRWYLDRAVAWEHARGLVAEDNDRVWERLSDELAMMRSEIAVQMGKMRAEIQNLQALLVGVDDVRKLPRRRREAVTRQNEKKPPSPGRGNGG